MTQRCLAQASCTSLPYTLVIVETGTDYFDEEADVYIYERDRTNATKSINRGLRACNTDYVVLLTNDTFVGDGWLEALVECFETKADCGLATLATTQLGHTQRDEISEGIWFSVAMMRRQDNYFDERFVNSWDDTDLIMRHYLAGQKMYRTYKVLAEHEPGKTHYADPAHTKNFDKNMALFKDKYSDYRDLPIYRVFTEGIVL